MYMFVSNEVGTFLPRKGFDPCHRLGKLMPGVRRVL